MGRFLPLLLAFAGVVSSQTRTVSPEDRKKLAAWLESQGGADKFVLDIAQATPAGLQLQLRFNATAASPAERENEFLNILAAPHDPAKPPVRTDLLSEVVKRLGISLDQLSVKVLVAPGETFSVDRDEARKVFISKERENKTLWYLLQRYPFEPFPVTPMFPGTPTPTNPGAPAALNDVENRIREFLGAYFKDQPQARITFEPAEASYAGATIEGIRGKVLVARNHWERLRIDIELKPPPLRATCYIDGKFASGSQGGNLPDPRSYRSMEPEYRAELDRFAKGFLSALQQHLSGAP